jgi:hypothetical protein
LQFASGDSNTGTPSVDAAAYINNEFATGAADGTTVLYDLDFGKDDLLTQIPPNNGTLNTIGSIGFTIDALAGMGFDIFSFAGDDTVLGDYGFAVYKRTAVSGGAYLLYNVDLQRGGTTNGRLVGGGLDFTGGFAVRPLAPGTLQFSAATYSVGENGPTASFSIFRTGGLDGTVTVNFTTTNGTADSGDYTDSDRTLVFGSLVGAVTVEVPITNDLRDESNETINLAITNPTGGATLGAQSTAVLTITDDDVVGINLVKLTNGTDNNSAPGPGVPIGSTVTFTYTVTNTGNVPLAGVTVVDDNGTAGSPADDFNATFVGGDTNGTGLLDPPETFTFTASRIATDGQYTNLGLATGTPVGGNANVQDGDLDNHFGSAAATPTPTPTAAPTATPTPTGTPAPTATPAPTTTPTPTAGPTLLGNISTRLRVEMDDNALIGGFIITGTQAKKVILRGIGPSTGVTGALSDPVLQLFDGGGNLLRSNDNWQSAPNVQEIIDSTIPPSSGFEPAILMMLPANGSNYTAVLRGFQNETGVGLVEAYDLDQSVDSRLANISTRGLVQLGDDVMIAGFIVLNGNQRVLVRGIAPSLTLDGKLPDPTLELRDNNGVLIRANDDWRIGGQEAEIIATTIPPTDDAESAIVEVLAPGSYTAILRGAGSSTGIAVVEVYALN